MKQLALHLLGVTMLALGTVAMAADNGKEQVDYEAVQKEMSQTVNSIGKFTETKKEQAMETASQAMTALERDIKRLERDIQQRASSMSAATRHEKQQALSSLREQRTELKQAYADMKEQSGEAWQKAVDAFEDTYREARDQWKNLAS